MFWYKDYYVERIWHNGYYSALGRNGYLKADTREGIKVLIKKDLS